MWSQPVNKMMIKRQEPHQKYKPEGTMSSIEAIILGWTLAESIHCGNPYEVSEVYLSFNKNNMYIIGPTTCVADVTSNMP